MNPIALLTSELRARYERDGVVVVRGALDPQWLQLIEMALDRVLGDGGQKKHRFFDDQPGEFLETVRNLEVTPELQRLMYDSPIADVIGSLIGSDNVWYYSDEFFIKPANSRRTPWHQDMPYWPIEGDQIASMWISLDTLTKDECLEYVPGSHRTTRYDGFNPRRVAEDPTLPHYGEELPPLPDIEADRSAWNIVSWNITPGDVILAHPGVLHGGGPTGPTGRRRTITIRCYGDDIVFATRPASKPTVPLTPGLALQLKPGDPLRSPWYPQLRPRPVAANDLADIEAIKQLKAKYFYYLDTKQWAALRELFTDDAVFDPAGEGAYTFDGLDGFIAGASSGLSNATSVHHGHMPIIELTGTNTASGIWAMSDYVEVHSDPPRAFTGYGHYHEVYRRVGGRWLIASWKLTRLRVDRH